MTENASFMMPFQVSPLLSVITITYKDPDGLSRTVESLRPLLSSPCQWEHVLVDGSPAENESIVAQLRAEQWPLRLVRQDPRGIYAAMNEGIAQARGKYLWFLNGGDQLKTLSAVQRVLEFLEKHPHYQISLSAAELHREGKFHYVRRSSSVARSLLGMNRVCHQALVYRRQVFERLGLYREEYKLAADYEHHLRAELAGLPTVILPEILVQYDLGGRSDNYDRVFAEFRGIHASLEKERSLGAQCLHLLVMYLEWFRVAIFKKLGKTQWAKPLKALWLAWQRRNERDLG